MSTPVRHPERFATGIVVLITTAGCATTRVPASPKRIAPPRPAPEFGLLSNRGPVSRGLLLVPETEKSYVIPAAEVVAFEFLLNQYDRHVVDSETFGSTWSSFEDNLHRGWVIDHDPFATNQVGHPYAGSMYHTFARSAGLNYWQSLIYAFLGSALWEVAGETTPPSLNDQITTGIGGTFLGESLFRVAGWVLDDDEGEEPGFFHELAAAIASPATFVNRSAFGERFDRTFPEDHPAVYTRLQFAGRTNLHVNDGGLSRNLQRNEIVAGAEVDYGLPGKPGYHYEEPFDYFHFEFDATSSGESTLENADARGMLFGAEYGKDDLRGIWGLFGEYSYFSPEVFRVSSTAVTVGTVGQWWLSERVALQGSLLGGAGYGAAGTIAENEVDRDYHYGVIPQAVLDLRLIFGDLVTFGLRTRDFYVSGRSSDKTSGHENIIAAQAELALHFWQRHAIGLQFDYARRDAPFSSLASRRQTVETASLVYSYAFGSTRRRLGAVEWREGRGQ